MLVLYLLLNLLSIGVGMKTNVVGPGVVDFCPASEKNCSFSWTIGWQQSMMFYDGYDASPVVWRNGSFYYRTECATDDGLVLLNETDLANNVVTMDGGYQYLKTVNNQFPGPSVVVYEGQEIEIQVKNNLYEESTGIHWHGLTQLNTNWMDGVPGTTQCPINPEETFTYRFIASPAGTHWYHSHQVSQRTEGLYGPFIVLPHPNRTPKDPTPNFTLPPFHKEFMMMVSENKPNPASHSLYSLKSGLLNYLYGGWNDTGHCFGESVEAPNAVDASEFQFHSGLINGKGHVLDANGNPEVDVPLEIFTVKQNKNYRFRVINAASQYAFKISVDEHSMVVIASDGMDINPIVADSFYVNTGERFDFYIYTNKTIQNYNIRSETIEYIPHHTLAILRYEGASATEKPTTNDTCKNVDVNCTIVNCPFTSFRRGPYVGATCINFESITSPYTYVEDTSSNFKEYFIAFGESRGPYGGPAETANGIMYMRPSSPPTVMGTAMYDRDCRNMPQCAGIPCHCTNQLNLPLGHTIQVAIHSNETHPIHLHGHHFQVLKVGYPSEEYDSKFRSLNSTQDIVCNNEFCNKAYWRNSSWSNGNVPGINTINPPLKDTISIPAGGYVVLRFKTDNPGWWLMHCHIDTHFAEGMGLIFQIGTDDEMRVTPAGFKTCGTYTLNQIDFRYAMTHSVKDVTQSSNEVEDSDTESASNEREDGDDGWTKREKQLAYGYIGVGLGALIIGILLGCCCSRNKKT